MKGKIIPGFSRLTKEEKIARIAAFINDPEFGKEVRSYSHPLKQDVFDSFSENTLANYYLPFGVAPNFVINGKVYHVPMVIEESSVVAAAAAAAKFWSTRGGFRAKVISEIKKGHVHFLWFADPQKLKDIFPELKQKIFNQTRDLTSRMRERGGGILEIRIEDLTAHIGGYYRFAVDFGTADSMGANFINTVLEEIASIFRQFVSDVLPGVQNQPEIIMSVLSNHVPDCLVECSIMCTVEEIGEIDGATPPGVFVHKFKTAVDIACIDPYRAATHNKGIMNGVDAVVLATGNDFRAVEAGVHAYASADGGYKSLSKVEVWGQNFKFSLKIPLAVGTVGGLTSIHPMARRAMQILGNPGASELMTVIATAGLANNFSAIKALVTKGIQQGHMKMHLSNILLSFQLDANQRKQVEEHFRLLPVSYNAVQEYIRREIIK